MASRTRRTVYRACWRWTSSSTRRGWRSGWIGSEAGPEGEPTQSRGEAPGGSGHGRDFPGAAQYPPPYRGHGRSHSSVPAVEVRPERLALLADHAEAVAAGRFHHPPGVDLLDLFRAQRHEALGLGVDIVGFDVQVDARGVVDLLQQQDRLVAFGGQTRVLAVAVLVDGLHALAQRLAPELDVRGEVVDLAVQDETRQSAVVGHAIDSRSEGRGCVPGWIQPISGRPSSARSTLWSRLASLRGMARMMPGAARAI